MSQYLQGVLDASKQATHVGCPEVFAQTRTNSTGSAFTSSHLPALALSLLVMYAPTGVASIYDLAHSTQRMSKTPYCDSSESGRDAAIGNAGSRLRSVRTALGLSVSDLASVLGVSRQAIYKWLAGGPISNLNHGKLEDLFGAVRTLVPFSESETWALGRRRDQAGQTLVQALKSGKTATLWAEEIANVLQDEQKQRILLDQIFSSDRAPLPVARELGVPVLNEQTD
ncbi:MAG: helix-turn-helix domain-containing protein [Terracidiphilus sp.]